MKCLFLTSLLVYSNLQLIGDLKSFLKFHNFNSIILLILQLDQNEFLFFAKMRISVLIEIWSDNGL